MSQKDLERQGLRHGPSANKAWPERMFIVGYDGEGTTEAERVEWIRAIFPKFAERLNPKDNDPRSSLPIPEDEIRVYDPACAKPVVYESLGAAFPEEGCGKWSGLPLLVVNTGRQTTKIARILNERRAPSPPTEIVVMAKRYGTTLDRIKANVIENRRIVAASPTERAWGAQRLDELGTPREDVMTLAGVKTEQGLKNLLSLLSCSPAVQAAVNAGPDNGGITQSAALAIGRTKDHDKQDVELNKRLDAAKGKSGREKSRALAGEDKRQKPVAVKTMARVTAGLAAIDRTEMRDATRVDEWLAIVRWAQGDDAGFDALPDEFRAAVTAAQKRVKAAKEPKPAKRGKRKPVDAPTDTAANDTTITTEREAA